MEIGLRTAFRAAIYDHFIEHGQPVAPSHYSPQRTILYFYVVRFAHRQPLFSPYFFSSLFFKIHVIDWHLKSPESVSTFRVETYSLLFLLVRFLKM